MGLDVDTVLKSKGLTRSKLAKLLGSNRSYVTNALKNPTLETLEKIALALDVDVRELFQPTKGGSILDGFVEHGNEVYRILSDRDLETLLEKVKNEG